MEHSSAKGWTALLLLGLLLMTACARELTEAELSILAQKAIVCNDPYIRHETGCCLDRNNNSICDVDDMVLDRAQPMLGVVDQALNVAITNLSNSLPPLPSNGTNNTSNGSNTTIYNTLPVYPAGQAVQSNSTQSGAVRLSFKTKAPPARVYDRSRSPFNISVIMDNIGGAAIGPESDNPYATVTIDGILPELFGKTASDLEQGMGQETPSQGSFTFNFADLNYYQRIGYGEKFMVRGTACYDYQTTALTRVCVHDDLLAEDECNTSMLENSAGPVIVAQAIQVPIERGQTQASFTIANKGEGLVFGRNTNERCLPSPNNRDMNNITIWVLPGNSTTKVLCPRFGNESAGSFIMFGGTPQTLSCFIERDTDVRGVTQEPLTIIMRYRYSQYVEQQLAVVS